MIQSSPGPIAFQGWPGAYSDMACRAAFPGRATLPCPNFEATIDAVITGRAAYAMLPCENSLVGRVPDIHALLPGSGLSIVAEHFQRIEHCLLGVPGAGLTTIRRVHSHPVALGQVRGVIRELGVESLVAGWNDPEDAAIASALAAELNGLTILRANVEDAAHNTTRFYITASSPARYAASAPNLMTTFIFAVRNVPAALFKALGGFATNGVNMTKLESYMVGGAFTATEFMCDVEGHPEQPSLRLALEELQFFSRELRILGVYERASFRDGG
jgi:prephenate dehydratase